MSQLSASITYVAPVRDAERIDDDGKENDERQFQVGVARLIMVSRRTF